MFFSNSVYYMCLVLSCIITASLGLTALQRSVNKGAVAFACLMSGAAIFSFCYIFKASSLTIYKAYFWLKLAYLGIAAIPVFWYIMIYQYTGEKNELSDTTVRRLFIIPALTLILIFTNDYHSLYYTGLSLSRSGSISLINIYKGPWYWVQLFYSYTMFLWGYAHLIKEWRHSQRKYRRRLSVFMVAAVAPIVSNLMYHMRITPRGMDLSPASFALVGLVFVWGMCRYGIFELIPIARNHVFETIGDAVIVVDMQNRIVDFNSEAENILRDVTDIETGMLFEKVLESCFGLSGSAADGLCKQQEMEIRKDNEVIYYNCTLSPVLDKKKSIIGRTLIMRNMTEQIMLRERLRVLATLDGLTNTFNRRYLLEQGRKVLEQPEGRVQTSSIIMLDIDLFKDINDTYGHKAGDNVLCEIAKVCMTSLRSTDIFARYGGEEFVCLLPNTSSKKAMQIAERIRRNLTNSILDIQGNQVRITASFGVSGTDMTDKTSLEELIRMADRALYDAKRRGRNCVSHYTGGVSHAI